MSDTIHCNDAKILRSDLTVKTRALLKDSEFSEGCPFSNYYADQESDPSGSIDNYVNYIMGKDGNWASPFEMVCVSIIYGVCIISIVNMKDGFMISGTLQSIDAYQISSGVIRSSDMNICLYCHMYKAPTIPSSRDICFNRFAYLHSIFHLAIGSRRQIYSGSRRNPNIVTIDRDLSSRDCVNNCTNVISPYSRIINSRQDVNSNASSIKTKKRKLIVESKGFFHEEIETNLVDSIS